MKIAANSQRRPPLRKQRQNIISANKINVWQGWAGGRGREGSQGCKLWGSIDGFVGYILAFKCATHGCQFRISWPQAIPFTELSPLVCSRIRVRVCAQRLSHAVMLRLEQCLGRSRGRGSSKWLCSSLGPKICCEMWHQQHHVASGNCKRHTRAL